MQGVANVLSRGEGGGADYVFPTDLVMHSVTVRFTGWAHSLAHGPIMWSMEDAAPEAMTFESLSNW